jgi:integrase
VRRPAAAAWPHIGHDAVVITTSKSKHRREAIIPLYEGLCDVLARIPKRSTVVLTSSRGRPWSDGGFGRMFDSAKAAAGIGPELHFHDLHGTAATRFYIAGLKVRVIAEISGWEEGIEKIIRKYVSRSAATKDAIRLLNKRTE